MSVLLSDIKLYAAAVTPEDDSVTGIGGAIDLTKKYDFTDIVGLSQGVSSSTSDTTQSVTVTYRNAAGAIVTATINLNGQTVVTNAAVFGRVLKAVKSAACFGDVAIESQTAEFTGTLDSAGSASPDTAVLPSGASGSDGYYNGMIFRVTGGAGDNEICEIIDYVGASRTVTFNRDASEAPYGPYGFDNTTVFRIAKGVFFDQEVSEIMTVVRMDYNTAANAPGGADLNFYLKGYFKHTDASGSGLTLNTCKVTKVSGNSRLTFALDTALNGSGTNGGGNNRQVAPSSGVGSFGTADVTTPSGAVMAPGDYIGVWVKLAAAGGAAALNESWVLGFQGQTA
jgi:hypothetical protein